MKIYIEQIDNCNEDIYENSTDTVINILEAYDFTYDDIKQVLGITL